MEGVHRPGLRVERSWPVRRAPTGSATCTAATTWRTQAVGCAAPPQRRDHTLTALKTIRAARPDGAPVYVILDNLSANKTPTIRRWAAPHKVELCLTPTSTSWADPIETQFGPLRMFTMANSDYPNHVVLARDMRAYLRWRNANARHPDVILAQRRERARVRSERHQRWGPPTRSSGLTSRGVRPEV